MFTSKFARTAGVCASSAAMVFASAYPAAADDDFTAFSDRSISFKRGTMTHIDDGDVFKICDTNSDGQGVYGALFFNNYYNFEGYQRVMTLNDGGDGGCDTKGHDITNAGSYTMVICWGEYPTNAYQISAGKCTHSGEFNE
ncbi:hypothetical protein [Streptomyces subrutilus]|uniref:hypothetical protein n=1 Tax=Streptomyces subrutilus TaxID=36818 RepID=UPI00340EBDFB